MNANGLKNLVEGKTVAIVGRAGSISGTGNGAAIDACDVVIRINWVLPIPRNQEADVGARTDLVYHCKRARTARVEAMNHSVPTYRVKGKRRRLESKRHFKKFKSFRFTTGAMAVIETLRLNPTEIRLFGFDFFASGHIQAREPEGDDYTRPLRWVHNPEIERKALKKIIARNPKIVPDAILKRALR